MLQKKILLSHLCVGVYPFFTDAHFCPHWIKSNPTILIVLIGGGLGWLDGGTQSENSVLHLPNIWLSPLDKVQGL